MLWDLAKFSRLVTSIVRNTRIRYHFILSHGSNNSSRTLFPNLTSDTLSLAKNFSHEVHHPILLYPSSGIDVKASKWGVQLELVVCRVRTPSLPAQQGRSNRMLLSTYSWLQLLDLLSSVSYLDHLIHCGEDVVSRVPRNKLGSRRLPCLVFVQHWDLACLYS